jgi:hypothetical protein
LLVWLFRHNWFIPCGLPRNITRFATVGLIIAHMFYKVNGI